MSEIMCTLTVKQILDQDDLVRDMYAAGMWAVRINTAHLDGVVQLQTLCDKLKSMLPAVTILIDTKGPEMRTTSVEGDGTVTLTEGMIIDIKGDVNDRPTDGKTIYVNYADIHADLKVGDLLLIDDGHLILEVDAIDGECVHTTVIRGGELGSRKGVAVKGVDVNLPAVSQHDRMYISYAAKARSVDVIAHSFVRTAQDVLAVKACMDGCKKPVIAKIENQQGIDHLHDILSVADGVLIARGDLTASIGRDAIPTAQAYIAAAAKAANQPLYLATNILPSMMNAPDASADDIEGIKIAQSQGVDVLLLTNETAAGSYPLETVRLLHEITFSL